MKLLTFGGSNSTQSINRKLANWSAHQVQGASVQLIDLNDYEMPIYGIDHEKEHGIPEKAIEFKALITQADGIVLSLAEHNGSYTTAFKNIFDWLSRMEGNLWENKPMFLLSTSPGGRGGASVMETAHGKFSRMNETPISTFSLPKFFENFDIKEGITNADQLNEFKKSLKSFEQILNSHS